MGLRMIWGRVPISSFLYVWIVFSVSFLFCSFQVYRNVISLYINHILLPCWTCLLVLINFFGRFLSTFYIQGHHVWKESFTSFFSIWMTFISLSCLIALARTSGSILDRSGKGSHPCLVADLKGKAFALLPLSMMSAVACAAFKIYF